MPAYTVEFAAGADERDFEVVFDFLEESYWSVGESAVDATAHAARRVERSAPRRPSRARAVSWNTAFGDHAGPPACANRSDQVIYWFFVDNDALIVRVLTVFGSQDHVPPNLVQLLQRS